MECGIEHSDLRRGGHNSLAGTDAHQVCGVMQGAQGNALLDGLDDFVIDDAGIEEFHAAVQNTVTDRVDLIGGLDDTVHRVNQNIQRCGDCFGMGGHGDIPDNLLAVGIVVQTAVNADTLTQTLGGYNAGLGIHQLILQRRRTGVDDQNVHWNLPPKNIVNFGDL